MERKEGFGVRTTIEISDKHRSVLLSLAAEKGLRGYSRIIEDALDYYIANYGRISDTKQKILNMKNAWSANETEETKARLNTFRANWKKL